MLIDQCKLRIKFSCFIPKKYVLCHRLFPINFPLKIVVYLCAAPTSLKQEYLLISLSSNPCRGL